MPLLPAAVATAVALVLCFVPLFDLLGYESAAAMGAVLGLLVLGRTAWAFDRGRLPPPLSSPQGPLEVFLGLLPGHLALVLPPAAVLLLNALRVKNCDLSLGISFWALIPAVSVVAGQALAFAVSWLPRARLPAALLVVSAQTGAFLWRLATDPPIAGHTWTIGWFAGSIYDEALDLPSALLWARLGVLLGSLGLVLALELAWRRRARRPARRAGVALALVLLASGTLHHERAELGIQHDQDSVKAALGGRLESPHFIIWYDPASLDEEGRRRIVEDHEFRYAELQAFFHEDPVAWKGRRIESFVYPNRAVQQALLGSRRTLVARPWTHQMHIRWGGTGETVLAHELAHLFSAPFGRGPLRLPMRLWGMVPDLALIEGVASAADAPPDELTAHQSARAMRELGLAADLRTLMGPAGFWTQPGRRAYTLVSSFVQWLIETRGIEAFKDAYGSGDLGGAYGLPLVELVGQWEAWVDQVPLSEGERALAGHRFRGGSIFSKVCARTIAELERQADQAEARGDLEQALALRERVAALQPRAVDPALELARLRARRGEHDLALDLANGLLAREDLGPIRTVQVQELAGDLRWEQGQADGAAATYTACLAEGLDEATLRRLSAKAQAAASPVPQARERGRAWFLDLELGGGPRLWTALAWAGAAPEDPLARTLVGRALHQQGQHADAIPWLMGPRGALRPEAADDERWLLLGEAALMSGQPLLAEGTYIALLQHTKSSRARALAQEGLARGRWARTGAVE